MANTPYNPLLDLLEKSHSSPVLEQESTKSESVSKDAKVSRQVTRKDADRDRLFVSAMRGAMSLGIPATEPYLVYKGVKRIKKQYHTDSEALAKLQAMMYKLTYTHKKPAAWEHTTDDLKRAYYSLAICQSPDPIAFTLNLSNEKTALALKGGATKFVQRALALQNKRKLGNLGFWFCMEFKNDGLLHLHGLMPKGGHGREKIRAALKVVGGPYSEEDATRSVSFRDAYSPIDWLYYATKSISTTEARLQQSAFSCARSMQTLGKQLYDRDRKIISDAMVPQADA